MTEFKSRAVRSLAELHETELRAFLATWRRFVASGKPMPPANGDESYASAETLVAHVQGAARSYLIWIWEVLGTPIPGMERVYDPQVIVPRLDAFMDETFAAWRTHLAPLVDEQLGPEQYRTRWGDLCSIDQMLEHAVVHPMRHRIQLERILKG